MVAFKELMFFFTNPTRFTLHSTIEYWQMQFVSLEDLSFQNISYIKDILTNNCKLCGDKDDLDHIFFECTNYSNMSKELHKKTFHWKYNHSV